MTSNDIAEAHDRAVALVDFLTQRQGISAGIDRQRAWDIALTKAEELEYWTGRAKKLDAAHDPKPTYDDQRHTWRWEKS